jgi:hypothetical protein
MSEFLLDFFVLADGGKVIFSHSSLLKCDEQLLGAYFHAINTIYNICFQRDLQKVSMNQYQLHFKKIEPFFFIGMSSVSIGYKSANNNFEQLSQLFYDKQSDVKMFHCFNSEVDKKLKEIFV